MGYINRGIGIGLFILLIGIQNLLAEEHKAMEPITTNQIEWTIGKTLKVTDSEALFDQIYSRFLRTDQFSQDQVAERIHLAWMAHLVDPKDPAMLSELANAMWQSGENKEQALRYMAEAFDRSSSDYYIGLDLLQKSVELEQWAYATEVAKELQKQHPEDVQLRLMLVSLFEQSNQLKAAIDLMMGLKEHRMMEIPANTLRLASMMWRAGNHGGAVDTIRAYMEKHADDPKIQSMLIYFYNSIDEKELAKQELEEQLTSKDASFDLLSLGAISAAQQKDYAKVEALIQRILATKEGTPEGVLGVIQTTIATTGNDKELIRTLLPLKEELSESGSSDLYGASLAVDYINLGDTLQGEKIIQDLVDKGSENTMPYYYFIEKYASKEDTIKLADVVAKGIKALPDDGFINLYTVLIPAIKGDTITYSKELNRALDVVPQDNPFFSQLSMMRAQEELEAGKWEEAKHYFELSLLHPTPIAYNNYAWALATKGTKEDLVRAEELSSLAIQGASEEPSHLDTHAWILYLKKAYPLARIYMERAIEHMDTEAPQALYYIHYAKILEALDDKAEALKAWEKAYELDPEEATEAVGRIKTLKSEVNE